MQKNCGRDAVLLYLSEGRFALLNHKLLAICRHRLFSKFSFFILIYIWSFGIGLLWSLTVRMSELIEKNEMMQEKPEISDAAQQQRDAEARDDGLQRVLKEAMNEQGSQLHTETRLEKTADLAENFVWKDIPEQSAMDTSSEFKTNADSSAGSADQLVNNYKQKFSSDAKEEPENDFGGKSNEQLENGDMVLENDMKEAHLEGSHLIETPLTMKQIGDIRGYHSQAEGSSQAFSFDANYGEGDESGSEEEQAAFMKELENFFKERSLEFKPPKFYGEGLNCLKLWRAVTRLGGYDQVTSCKLWRQVGESFNPPKTCTTVSWSFRCFYEKALLEYEKHKVRTGELQVPLASIPEPISADSQAASNQASASGRARRDAAARAMQGWHSQRLLGNGEVGDPIIKDKSSGSLLKKDKHIKSIGSPLKRKKPSSLERAVKAARTKIHKPQADSVVVDVGSPADWVKINVRRTKDCYEVYALVPGLLREEVHVQSDPAGRLIISGEPEQPENPWGVAPFKKVITLPSRIDPHQTSAVVTLHGQLFVRAPFEQSDL